MKSDICTFSAGKAFDKAMIAEINKAAEYGELDKKSTLRLTLMAEELLGMLPNLSEGFDGSFWIESEGSQYELHAQFTVEDRTLASDEAMLSVSKSGKNAAAKGVIGKIRGFIDRVTLPEGGSFFRDYAIFSGSLQQKNGYAHCWSLNAYAMNVMAAEASEEKENAWDELEKSVIRRLADDVLVGIRGNQVEITVKKMF